MTSNTNSESIIASSKQSVYQPLDEEYHFRILRLLPGEHDEELRGELQLRALDEDGLAYEAISYTWGKQLDGDTCIINGRETTLGVHLGNALRRIRTTSQDRFLWVEL